MALYKCIYLLTCIHRPTSSCVCLTDCGCNVDGTVGWSRDCHVTSGQCSCRSLVDSRQCDECVDGAYNLQRHNAFGCQRTVNTSSLSTSVCLSVSVSVYLCIIPLACVMLLSCKTGWWVSESPRLVSSLWTNSYLLAWNVRSLDKKQWIRFVVERDTDRSLPYCGINR